MGTEIALITRQILFLPYVSLQHVLWHQGGRQRTSIVPLVSSYYPESLQLAFTAGGIFTLSIVEPLKPLNHIKTIWSIETTF